MPKKTVCGPQPPEDLHDERSVDDILAHVDQFVEGVYRDLSLAPPTLRHFETRRSLSDNSSPNVSPIGAATSSILSSGDESRNMSPCKLINMDAEIERINRMCDSVGQDLRSIGVLLNNSGDSSSSSSNINIPASPVYSTTNIMSDLNLDSSPRRTATQSTNSRSRQTLPATIPTQVIDLSETQTSLGLDNINNNNANDDDDDDDVILVSANINPVVDLCTPGGDQRETSRRRRLTVDHIVLNRRRLQTPDVQVVDTCDVNVEGPTTARRRRIESRKTTSDILQKEIEKSPSSTDSTAAGPTPFMCAVCMESYLQRQPTSTRCGHVFCNECLTQALRLTRKCPLCNTKISRNHIFRIYP